MSEDKNAHPDPEPDFKKHPDEWRSWRYRQADKYTESGGKTSFGFWRDLHEDIRFGPSSPPPPPKKQFFPIKKRGDPETNIFRLAADNKKRHDSYPVATRVQDLVSFGLLPEGAAKPYLDLAALYLHMTQFKKHQIVTPEDLDQALENWAAHHGVEEKTKITLAFDDYIRPEDYKWLKKQAKKNETSILQWVARCRWATATFFKH